MFSELDTRMMHTALTLAQEGRYSTSPNPRVGCVLAHGSQIVGQGFHLIAGGPHAEVHALNQAGSLAQGATAYVTLEPCSHYGRTPPCAQALIQAGVRRVVAAMTDPNPLVSGKGLAMLQAAGIDTQSGLLENEARLLNRGFLSRIERNRPYITIKSAASMDGKTALSDGQSQWITGSAARTDVHRLRAESCAVLTGIGTILADNPLLNVRALPTLRQPSRIILDSRLRTPVHSQIIQDSSSPTLLVTLNSNPKDIARFQNFPHVRILHAAEKNGQIDLAALMPVLAAEHFGHILVEAGTTLSGAFIQEQLADEIILYQSAKILGHDARALFRLPQNADVLTSEADWRPLHSEILGNDVKLLFRRQNK